MMSPRSLAGSILVLASLASIVEAQSPPGRAYKVAFWYELARPYTTTRHRAYDLARGEYDQQAVDRWLRTIETKHPGTGATVRDLTTVGEPGATEAERLNSAIEREKRRWAELNRGPSRPRMVGPLPSPRTKDDQVGRASFDKPAPGSPDTIARPSSPFPYPYRSGPR